MKSKVSKYYDNYWQEFGDNQEYERDSIFPTIFKKGEKVLDVACGDGKSTAKIKKLTQTNIYGLEFSQKGAEEASKRGVITKVGSVEDKFPYKNGEFDTVFWGDNIEHLFFPENTLKEIYRVLKPKGRLIISTPNISYWRYRMYFFLYGQLPDTEYNGKQVWEWSHIRFFNLSLLKNFLSQNKFNITNNWGINRRKLDRNLVKLFPNLFGMILVVEAYKNS